MTQLSISSASFMICGTIALTLGKTDVTFWMSIAFLTLGVIGSLVSFIVPIIEMDEEEEEEKKD